MKSLIIVNPADCIGCRTCEVACVVAHPSEQELNADVFLPRLKVQRPHMILHKYGSQYSHHHKR